ncbi:MAG: hypothetical protein ACOX4W_01745 [Bacilli bacterium]|jgi:hypothetical protein
MKSVVKLFMLICGICMMYCFYSAFGYLLLASKQPRLIAVDPSFPNGRYTGFLLMSGTFFVGAVLLLVLILVLNKFVIKKIKTNKGIENV